ncbi:MAG: pknK [Cyanobacteria bacterium RYN_339]|nr:pknK [Cyanobacteria bacterium RYN_339]
MLLPRPRLTSTPPVPVLLLVAGPGAGKTCAARLLAEAWGPGVEILDDVPEDVLAVRLAAPGRPLIATMRQLPAIPLARRIAQGEVQVWGPAELFLDEEEAAAWAPGRDVSALGGWPLGVHAGGDKALTRALVDEEWIMPMPAALRAAALEQLPDPELVRWGMVRADGSWVPLARERLQAIWEREVSLERLIERGALDAILARGETKAALAVANAEGERLRKSGDFQALGALLEKVPADARRTDPGLLLLDGAALLARGDHAEAEARFEAAASAFDAGGDRAHAFEALNDLLHLHWTRQDFAAFERLAERAAPFEPDATLVERIEYLNNLACHRFGRGDEEAARTLFRKVLDYPHFDDAQAASVQQVASINLGILAMEAGDFDEATRHFQRVLGLAARFQLKPSVPRGARLYLAGIALKLGDRHRAEEAFQALAQNPFPAEERYRQAEFLMLEGDYHLMTGEYPTAEARYRAALEAMAAIRMDESAGAGTALNKLAVLHRRRGEHEAAAKLHARALGMVKDWARYKGAVLHDWAITLMEAGDLTMADARMQAAFEALDKVQAPYLMAGVRLASAVLAERLGLPADAARRLEAGLELVRQGPYYYVAIAQRELAPELWALMARTGQTAMLGRIEGHFPQAATRIRAALGERPALPPVAGAALAIRCFGILEVEVAGEPIKAWPRKKAKALLATLLLNPRGFARDELADLLFPDLGMEEAEHQLDNLASALRKMLEPGLERRQKSRYLIIKDRHYRFDATDVELDFQAFDRLVKEGQEEEAIALYRGDLLEEPLLMEWFDIERLRYKTRARELLAGLSDRAFASQHFEEARAYAERLLALDPTSEDGHRRLMAIYGQFGQRDLVHKQYELCKRLLKEQLDAEPTRETRALWETLGRTRT